MNIEHGELTVKALLTLMINDTLDFFNVGKSMSDRQVAQTVELIIEEYSVYKPDFFKLCFKRAMKGQYGATYDRIDGQIIFQWLEKFHSEYCSEVEAERVNQKKVLERKLNNIQPDEPVSIPKHILDLVKNVNVNSIEAGKTSSLTSVEDRRISELISNFHHNAKIHNPSGMRFIEIEGRKLDLTEYLKSSLDPLQSLQT